MLETIIMKFYIGVLYLLIGGSIFVWFANYMVEVCEDLQDGGWQYFLAVVAVCIGIGFLFS